ncbi:hypothetical protein [Streptomyces sp. CB01881]|uniref:hypothetical protein n=1 Tax=Streptomyces sp. CB01881 TaxID=2078691 RepID=UPI000CDC8056|nr:hypothetical protein [Streptomyces sp. CB01881]AUY52493.1 hypothetical protein C2142_30280 [Streptomyces sp. CB01881]TYC71922.1 hypothetical protein EH183_30265 [Streptomyces sp. CB01881]
MSLFDSARPITRRRLLTGALAATGAAAVHTLAVSRPAAAQPADRPNEWTERVSANGWPVVTKGLETVRVEGSDIALDLLPGAVTTVLAYVTRRFHYEITALAADDVHGYTTRRAVAAPYESNYLSGTAIALHPGMYPAGVRDGLFPNQLIVIRDILAQCDGVVRWGGDEKVAKESHFQIDTAPNDDRLKRLAAKLGKLAALPGQGAGSGEELAFTSPRLGIARSLWQQQQSR